MVTGTAAPIIALAATVSLAEADKEFFGFLMTNLHNTTRLRDGMKPLAQTMVWLAALGVLNLFLQAALLAVSLVSLAEDANSVPPWLAIAVAVGGLLLLAVSSIGSVRLHVQNQLVAMDEMPPE